MTTHAFLCRVSYGDLVGQQGVGMRAGIAAGRDWFLVLKFSQCVRGAAATGLAFVGLVVVGGPASASPGVTLLALSILASGTETFLVPTEKPVPCVRSMLHGYPVSLTVGSCL